MGFMTMEIKPEEFLYKLQQHQELALPHVIVVFGEEDYYRSRLAAAVPEYIFAGVPAEDRQINVFEKDTKAAEVEAAINTYPFFSGSSLVILKDDKLFGGKQESESKKQQLDKLAELMGDVPDYCTVLIVAAGFDKRTKLFKTLKKEALLCECVSLKINNLQPWLHEQAERYGAHFEYEAVGTIMEYLAPVEKAPLALLQQEIAKLALYTGERKSWTRQDVETIFSALPEVSNFAILNFIAERRLLDVLRILADERKKGTNILPLCALISFKLRQMLQFMELRRNGYNAKSIAGELKLHPYAAGKLDQQVRRFDEKQLRRALQQLAMLNIELRRGGRDYARLEEILLELLS